MRTVVDVGGLAGRTSIAVQAGPEAVASPSALRLAGPASRIKDKLIPRTTCAPGSPYPLARSRVKAPGPIGRGSSRGHDVTRDRDI